MENLKKFNIELSSKLHHLALSSINLQDFVVEAAERVREHFKSTRVNIYFSVKEPFLYHYCTSTTSGTELTTDSNIYFGPNEGVVGKLLRDNLSPEDTYIVLSSTQFNSANIKKSEYLNYSPDENLISALIIGENRVLGAIELIDVDTSECDLSRTVYKIIMTAQIFSMTIGTLLRSELVKTIQNISTIGIDVLQRKMHEEDFLTEVARLIIDEELINYSVAIIRIYSHHGEDISRETYGSKDSINWSKYINQHKPNSESPSIECYTTGKIVSLSKIDNDCILRFENREWIEENNLKAYICVPIKDSEKCIGTISFFLKYYYNFNNSDFVFLRLLAHSIGKTLGLDEILNEARRKVTEDVRASVRKISDLNSVKEFSHHYKNEIRAIQTVLNKVIPTLSKGKVDDLRKLNAHLGDRKAELEQFIKNTRGEDHFDEVFSLAELLNDIVAHFRSELQYHGIALEKNFAEVPFVNMDRNQLLEAISNIFQNAIKSFELVPRNQNKLISLSLYIDSSYDEYCILISDNGIGIKNDLLPDRIFEEGVTGFPGEAGTGQGLFYSKSIIDSFTGDIEVTSSMNKGTTFVINFPRKRFEDR